MPLCVLFTLCRVDVLFVRELFLWLITVLVKKSLIEGAFQNNTTIIGAAIYHPTRAISLLLDDIWFLLLCRTQARTVATCQLIGNRNDRIFRCGPPRRKMILDIYKERLRSGTDPRTSPCELCPKTGQH